MSTFTLKEVHASLSLNLSGSENDVKSATSAHLAGLSQSTASGQTIFEYAVKDRHVCRTAFLLYYGISDWKLRQSQKNARAGTSLTVHNTDGMQRQKTAYSYVLGWVTSWFEQVIRG